MNFLFEWVLPYSVLWIAGGVMLGLLVYGWWVRRTASPEEVNGAREKMARIKEERARAWRNPHYREKKRDNSR